MNLPLLGNTQNVLTVCVLASDLHSFSSRNTETQQMPQQNTQVSLLESFQLEFIIDTIIGHQEHVWIIMYEGISQHSCSNTTGHPNPSHQRCQRMCSRPSIGSKPAASIPRSKWYQAVLKHRHPSAVDILSRYELFKMIQNVVVPKPIALSVPTDNLSVDLDAAPPWRKGFNGLLYYIILYYIIYYIILYIIYYIIYYILYIIYYILYFILYYIILYYIILYILILYYIYILYIYRYIDIHSLFAMVSVTSVWISNQRLLTKPLR